MTQPFVDKPPTLSRAPSGWSSVVLVRHGERADEVRDGDMLGRPHWDPPLTPRGTEQARAAGERLRPLHASRPWDCVYASPCLRTMQTASHIAAVLDLPLCSAPGLAECAAAVQERGIESFQPEELTAEEQPLELPRHLRGSHLVRRFLSRGGSPRRFMSEAEVAPFCAPGVRFAPADTRFEGFQQCAERLAARGRHVLLVTHREGIRDLCAIAGEATRRTEYCCVAPLRFDSGRLGNRVRAARDGAWMLLAKPSARGPLDWAAPDSAALAAPCVPAAAAPCAPDCERENGDKD